MLPIWQCRKTGDCCKRFISLGPEVKNHESDKIIEKLNKNEITEHLKNIGISKETVIESIKNHQSLPLQDQKTCVFLKNNECLIHEIKPEVCKTYPLKIDYLKEKTKILVDLDCPRGSGLIEAIKIGPIPNWIKTDKPIEVEGRYFYEDMIRDKHGEDA